MAIDLRTRQIGQYFSTGIEEDLIVPARVLSEAPSMDKRLYGWLRAVWSDLATDVAYETTAQLLPAMARRRSHGG